MKWSLKHPRWPAVCLIFAAVVALRAAFVAGSDDATAGSPLEAALYRLMNLPGGTVVHSRPPWEAKRHVTDLLQRSPQDADLYSLRARQEELLQQYSEAEADWKAAAAQSQDKHQAASALADFYARRNQPEAQVSALLSLAALEPPNSGPAKPFLDALAVAQNAQLPSSTQSAIYEAWIARDSKQIEPYQSYLTWLVAQKNVAAAKSLAVRIQNAFPADQQLAITTQVDLARAQAGDGAALQVFDKKFSALWPDALRKQYFAELTARHQLRAFLGAAQQQASTHPADLAPVTRLFFYYEQQDRKPVADQQLLAFEARRDNSNAPWTPAELRTCGELFARVQDWDESAHSYYQLFALPAASSGDKEYALAQLISLLLDVPEQPFRFGSRDLSLYKNIALMDRHPGFLNGIASIALQGSSPQESYQSASQNALVYFHRATASRLLSQMQQQYPRSRRISGLQVKLFRAYQTYGQQDALIRYVPAWMQRNRNSPSFIDAAFLLADAYVTTGRTDAELKLYDSLLAQVASNNGHLPITPQPSTDANVAPAPPSPYAQVLDRYVSRLVQMRRPLDAVALFKREIDRNPDDPGIYERLALFVEQNHLESDLEQTYKTAFAHFNDASWASKLARFYLRLERYNDYEALTRHVIETFKGSAVAPFLDGARPTTPQLYLRLNLYAHQRFPHNLAFVHNLLAAYQREETRNAEAYSALLRENWFYEEPLRNQFFAELSRTGTLRQELAALPPLEQATKDSNLAALQCSAYGRAWLTDYEGAAPAFARLAELVPGERSHNADAISVERSLGYSNRGAFESALKFARQDVAASPADPATLTRVGEIYADHELYAQARPWWDKLPSLQPGSQDTYLEAATVFWDYYQFDDAQRTINLARHNLNDRWKFSYESGAIYENQDKLKEAIGAYANGVLHDAPEQSQARLLRLATRPATADLVDRQTSAFAAGAFDQKAFELRLAVLEKLNRRAEIETFLTSELNKATAADQIQSIQNAADRLQFERIAAAAMQHIIGITADPIEKLQAQLDLAHFYESHNEPAAAAQAFTAAYASNPERLGVLRALVDFEWRNKQTAQAVQTLAAAAAKAQPPYASQLRREAAGKATESAQYDTARQLLDQLLASDPWNGDLLAAKAQTYARQGDQKALVNFYASQLDALKHSALTPPEKTLRTAALRRGYVAALIAVGQQTDALEQYQLLINSYPEDQQLIAETARFASDHELAGRLLAYYSKAAADAPRDYRWPIVVARIDTALHRYADAVAAYDKAGVVRPDRRDIFEAKAELQLRLLRFQDVLATYAKLYELSYHDTQYLAAQASVQARLGNQEEALKLLRSAYIAPHPDDPSSYLPVMRQEASWRNFATVDQLFQEARGTLSKDDAVLTQAVQLEAEALTALHRPQDAVEIAAASLPPKTPGANVISSLGQMAREVLTPADKEQFASFLENGHVPPQLPARQIAKAAGLAALEAKLDYRAALTRVRKNPNTENLEGLQGARFAFEELGQQLEAIAAKYRGRGEDVALLERAYRAYASAGDTAAQTRLLPYSGTDFPRLFVQTGGDGDGRLQQLAKDQKDRANAVVQYLVSNGSEAQAVRAIAARGQVLGPLWIDSYTALSGLYFSSREPQVAHSFDRVLGPRTVGSQLSDRTRDASLRGEDWFYYAQRYGGYLGQQSDRAAADLLPASLEANGVASNNYLTLAEAYLELKNLPAAEQTLRDALQLSADRADLYDRLAVVALASKQREKAIESWRAALNALAGQVEQGPLPEVYWSTFQSVLVHVNRYHLTSELSAPEEAALRSYAARNRSYRFTELVKGLLEESPDPQASVRRLIEISRWPDLDGLFNELIAATWIPAPLKAPLYEASIAQMRKALDSAPPAQREIQREQFNSTLSAYAAYLETQKKWAEEWSTLQQIQPPASRNASELLVSGALTGHLPDLLASYRANPETTPTSFEILRAAAMLDDENQHDSALALKDFEYTRQVHDETGGAAAWFGLAQVRFEQKRTPEALQLIRDVSISEGAPFQNLPEAVRLLDEMGMIKEAIDYAKEWSTAEPWNPDARFALARLAKDSAMLNEIRTSASTPYHLRSQAAQLLAKLGSSAPGSDELAVLTRATISATDASHPFFVDARLAAANQVPPTERIRLYREALEIDPANKRALAGLAEAAFRAGQPALGLIAFDRVRLDQQLSGAPADAANPQPVKQDPALEELAAAAALGLQQYGRAANLYQQLLGHTTDPAQRAAFEQKRTAARHAQQLASANAARSPIINDSIKQSVIVKPRLTSWRPALYEPYDAPASETEPPEKEQ